MADANYTDSMFNQPATYPSGNGVLIPNTTYLRYFQPAYTTFDASIGIAKDNWYAELYGDQPGQLPRQHVHLVGAVHQIRGAAAAAGGRPEVRRQLLDGAVSAVS